MSILAFPTATGNGARTVGGRGGKVLFVKNLADDGSANSLRWCLQQNYPRIVIPLVKGTLTLTSIITNIPPNLTLLFCLAPIQVKGSQKTTVADGIMFDKGEVIVRGMRDREGGPGQHDQGVGMIFYGQSSTNRIKNVIIDHTSYEWGIDAPMQFYGYVENWTAQETIIAEGASNIDPAYPGQDSGHKGDHSNCTGAGSIHRCLYVSNGSRNPLMQSAPMFDFRNNVVYNWGGNNGGQFGEQPLAQKAIGNIVGNVYLEGPDSGSPCMVLSYGPIAGGTTKVFAKDNWTPNNPDGTKDQFTDILEVDTYWLSGGSKPYGAPTPSSYKAAAEYPVPDTVTLPTASVLEYVLSRAGARMPFTDSADAHAIQSVINNTGNIAAIGPGGPWPDLKNASWEAPADSNQDGVPDFWAIHMGFDVMAMIAEKINPDSGYAYVEEYAAYMCGDYPGLLVLGGPVPPFYDPDDPIPGPDPTPTPTPVPLPLPAEITSGLVLVALAAVFYLLWSKKEL